MYNIALRKKAKEHKKAALITVGSLEYRLLRHTTFLPSADKILTLRKENSLDHPYTKHQSQAKKSKISFKAKGNILTFIEGANEDILRKYSKEGSKCET